MSFKEKLKVGTSAYLAFIKKLFKTLYSMTGTMAGNDQQLPFSNSLLSSHNCQAGMCVCAFSQYQMVYAFLMCVERKEG